MNVKTTTTIKWVRVKNKETRDKVKNDIIKGKVYIWQPLLKLIERHVKTCGQKPTAAYDCMKHFENHFT